MQVVSVPCCYAVAGLFFGAFAASGPAFLAMSGLGTSAFGGLLFLMTVGALPAMTLTIVLRQLEPVPADG